MRFSVMSVLAIVSVLTGCIIRTSSDDDDYRRPPSQPAPTTTTTTTREPILAIVDSNQTMQANAGQGVGIFVEYNSGGHWNLWWTCDTDVSGLSCNYKVDVVVESGEFANITSDRAATDNVSSPDGKTISAITTTSKNLVRLTFDTAPGATIKVSASVSGESDPAIFFFVQNGKVRGDYTGALTNPLRFRGTTP